MASGTLFRFPLRTQPSRISSRAYAPSQILDLFQKLREQEADFLLLFLANLSRLNLVHIDANGARRTVLSVSTRLVMPDRGISYGDSYKRAVELVRRSGEEASAGKTPLGLREMEVAISDEGLGKPLRGQEGASGEGLKHVTRWIISYGAAPNAAALTRYGPKLMQFCGFVTVWVAAVSNLVRTSPSGVCHPRKWSKSIPALQVS